MREVKENEFGAKVVNAATQSLINYSNQSEANEFLMIFLNIGGLYISNDKEKARETLIGFFSDKENDVSKWFMNSITSGDSDHLFDVTTYEHHFARMSFSSSIDNFITYFKEILAEVVVSKPQVLKSKDLEQLNFILKYDSMDDLLKAISEKKINELFYKGISDIEKFFDQRLGIKLFKTNETKKNINRLIKQRNLIVHNRGKISEEYIKDHPEDKFEVGLYLIFNFMSISSINKYLHNYLVELDIEIAEKFKLKLIRPE